MSDPMPNVPAAPPPRSTFEKGYLSALRFGLRALPRAERDAVLDDYRAHITDALESGRRQADILSELGAPEAAAQAVLHSSSEPATVDGDHTAAVHSSLAVGAAVVSGLTSVVSALYAHTGTGPLDRFPLLLPLLTLVPGAVCALPVAAGLLGGSAPGRLAVGLTHTRGRVLTAAAAAFLATLFTALPALPAVPGGELLQDGEPGMFAAPLALLCWAALLTPLCTRASRHWTTTARIAAAVLLASPVLLLLGALLTGTFAFTWPAAAMGGAWLFLTVCWAVRVRWAYAAVAGAGALLMLVALVELGLIMLAVWWLGGLALTLGLSAWAFSLPSRDPSGLVQARARPGRRPHEPTRPGAQSCAAVSSCPVPRERAIS